MPIITTAIGFMLLVAAGAVIVGTLLALQPMWKDEQEPGSGVTTLMIGLAATLIGAAAITAATRDDTSSTMDAGLYVLGGLIAVVGLTVVGIASYNLSREDARQTFSPSGGS